MLILRWILTRCLAPLPQSRLIGRTVSPPLPLVKSLPRLRPPPSGRHIQHTLLQPLDDLSFRSLLETQPIRSRARPQAASRRGASGWLHILPIKAPGYPLAPRVVRAALRYRLGVRIFASVDSSLCPLCKVKPALLDRPCRHLPLYRKADCQAQSTQGCPLSFCCEGYVVSC